MSHDLKFFIDGAWVDPVTPKTLDVINPATEESMGRISIGSASDVDKAVKAARRAIETWGFSTREERLALLRKILKAYQRRYEDLAQIVSQEMGAPLAMSRSEQIYCGQAHIESTI